VSIIYDALQKTQTNRSKNPKMIVKKSPFILQWFNIGMLITIIILFSIVIYAYYPNIKKLFTPSHHVSAAVKSVPRSPVIAATPNQVSSTKALPTQFATGTSGKITVNGVFISEQDNFALINNKEFHVGDTVEGMKIIAIQFDKVYFRDANINLVIRTTA
jgi:hypothetical protein